MKEYRAFTLKDFLRLNKMREEIYFREKSKLMFAGPILMGEEAYIKLSEDNRVAQGIRNIFGTRSMLFIPFKTAKDQELYIAFFNRKDTIFMEDHLQLVKKLMVSFKLAMEKHLAYDEINELNDKLQREKAYLEEELNMRYNFGDMIGESEVMQGIFEQVGEIAALDANVLIQGETGTGKELIARAIHENSPRKHHLLVKVNCAALPTQIIESELFGHAKGAFTGAIKERVGKFELADKGTIFLDEISELPLELQAKLLRVIQEKEVERIGSNATRKLDFRLIAATNRDLNELVRNGLFRADLFYRLYTFPINLPPLRMRGNDIMLIAKQTAHHFSNRLGTAFKGFSTKTEKQFLEYNWPGNVRELQSLVQQGILSSDDGFIQIVPGQFPKEYPEAETSGFLFLDNVIDEPQNITMEVIREHKESLEKAYIKAVLQHTKWRVSGPDGAAKMMGMNASTLDSRLSKLGINRKNQ